MELKDRISHWTTGQKDGIGTALSDASHVYFTIGRGRPTEIYFPSPDKIVIHSITLFLEGKISETDFDYSLEIPNDYAPFYRIFSKCVEKEVLTNPDSDELLIMYKSASYKNTLKIAFPEKIEAARIKENTLFVKTKNAALLINPNIPFSTEQYEKFALLHINSNKFLLRISFGKNEKSAEKPLFKNKTTFEETKNRFIADWEKYAEKLHLEGKGMLYKRSIIAMKCMEDKKYKGTTVASLAIPWGSKAELSEQNGYHLVWARDLFFVSIAMYLAGDKKFANSSLNYMVEKLMRLDGSFKQNATINGNERWSATQMDQIAFPIILAHFLKRSDLIYKLEKSADYIVKNGPWSEQERWEEIAGFSPYAMSLQSKALNTYADMRESVGIKAEIYRDKAGKFAQDIYRFCYIKHGIFPPYEYFVRISKGNPGKNKMYLKGKYFTPQEMISTDFLYLVFTGLYSPNSPLIENSIKAVDNVLRVETPGGPSFYRYNGDIYGFDGSKPEGKLWIILTAERGIYKLMRGRDAKNYLRAIEHFATSTYLLPEQIFEDGKPTESATPLAWSHAAYIILHSLFYDKNLRNRFSSSFL